MKFEKNLKIASKKAFDSEQVYNEKYLKGKLKPYNGKIKKKIYNNKISKEGSQCIFLSVILINSIFKTGKIYYPQLFLEECKYVVKENKIPKYIIDNIEISSDSDWEKSGEEN